MSLKVITNNQWRNFLYRNEVPEKVLREDFDYHTDDIFDGYIKYRGDYYHLDEFIVDRFPFNGVPPDLRGKWDAFRSDSFFSGLAIKVSDNGEQYKIALVLG